jgi:uncharacterized protein (DUF2267 family)
MKDRYAAEIADLSKRLAQVILQKQGDRLLEDPGDVDRDVLSVLREVGKGTTAEVLNALSSRLSELEKKDRT